jgi:hypothetical protein
MTDEVMSPLRRRMIEDMTIRSLRRRPSKASEDFEMVRPTQSEMR